MTPARVSGQAKENPADQPRVQASKRGSEGLGFAIVWVACILGLH